MATLGSLRAELFKRFGVPPFEQHLELKDGEVLRESQLTAIRAFAEFLRNSNVRIDTSQVRNLNVGGRSIWAQLLGE